MSRAQGVGSSIGLGFGQRCGSGLGFEARVGIRAEGIGRNSYDKCMFWFRDSGSTLESGLVFGCQDAELNSPGASGILRAFPRALE